MRLHLDENALRPEEVGEIPALRSVGLCQPGLAGRCPPRGSRHARTRGNIPKESPVKGLLKSVLRPSSKVTDVVKLLTADGPHKKSGFCLAFFLKYRISHFTLICMETTITSTEAARHLGDFLARVKHAGESFLLTRSGKPLARLVPVRAGARAKGAEIMHSLARLPLDPDFAGDLERVNSMDRVPENPWA